jgi:large subunit ribosomal protein L17
MQHNRAGRKLRRTTSHRLALFSNQLASLMTHERIQTTIAKAKELRPLAERLITAAKNDGVAARRRVYRWIPDHRTVAKVFESIAPRFVDRPGGYTRILKLGPRRGDAAEAAILEFVDYRFKPKEKGPKKESLTDRARRMSGGRVETVRKQKAEPEEEGATEEAPRKSPKKAKGGRGEGVKAARPAPKKGPSRTGPSKRGA